MAPSENIGPWHYREIRGGALFIEWEYTAAVKCTYCGNMFSVPSSPEGIAVVPEHAFHEMNGLDCPGSNNPGDVEDLSIS